jgi:beta-glucosidase/6-phospho-beta-glucosidase/beta-galactosidase
MPKNPARLSPPPQDARFKISIGIEGTYEPVSGRDTLAITRHYLQSGWKSDLQRVRELGLQEVRYPIPWHRVESRRGRYEWGLLDEILNSATEEFRLEIIADTLHHTSFPRWLKEGFLNPEFPAAYEEFVWAFAQRYPRITVFTPFNEPTCTLDFCGARGFWYPYAKSDAAYVQMLRHSARATASVIRRLRSLERAVYILHVDTFEHHAALDRASEERAMFLNERRFVFDELLLGRVDSAHPIRSYLEKHGFSQSDLDWHIENPAPYDERGGNYYPLNEEQLEGGVTKHAPSLEPRGFAEVAKDYAQRLPGRISLTETNIQGTVRDRISWLKYMLEQAERLAADGIQLERFAWYPLFDCAGWNALLHGPRWKRDPQGIFSCSRSWERTETEFSAVYAKLSQGIRSADIPAYAFSSTHDGTLGPLKKQMHWNWIPPPHSGAPERRQVEPLREAC